MFDSERLEVHLIALARRRRGWRSLIVSVRRSFSFAQVTLEETSMTIEDEFFDFVLLLKSLNRMDGVRVSVGHAGRLVSRRTFQAHAFLSLMQLVFA